MNPLHLSGFGIKLTVQNLAHLSQLEITNGTLDDRSTEILRFKPRQFPYDSILLEGETGYITLRAFQWLAQHNIPIYQVNYDGTLLSVTLPQKPYLANLRIAQVKVSLNSTRRLAIAKALITGKVAQTINVLTWLAEKRDVDAALRKVKFHALGISSSKSLGQLRLVEAHIAREYWNGVRRILPDVTGFHSRKKDYSPSNANDPVNCALNYGYAILAGECLKAVNAAGLDPTVGFMHECKNIFNYWPLVCDLVEPFRWLVEWTVLDLFLDGELELESFYFTGQDYRYRFEEVPKQLFISRLRQHFNGRVSYLGHSPSWSELIQKKTGMLVEHLLHKTALDFASPVAQFRRNYNTVKC